MRFNSFKTFSFIYFPFLWIQLTSTAIYSVIYFFILANVSFFGDSLVNILFPGLLVSAGYIFFYKEKVSAIPKLSSDMIRAYVIVLACSVPAPIVFQHVVLDLTIQQHEDTRYQEIKVGSGIHQYFLKDPIGLQSTMGMYPRYYTSYNKNAPDDSHFEVFMVGLVKHNEKSQFWFGKKYDKVLRKDRSSNSYRDSVYNETIRRSITSFEEFFKIKKIAALEWNRKQDNYQYYEQAIKDIGGNLNLPILTELESRKPVETTLRAAMLIFVLGQLIWMVVCAFVRVDEEIIDDHGKLSVADKLKQRAYELLRTFSWFIPRKNYLATPLLVSINILVFLALGLMGVSMMSPSGQDLITFGSNFSPLVYEGELWRLFTAGFLHFGFVHLMMNMVALGFSGYLLEQVLGSLRLFVLYIISVLGCSLASLYWHHPGNSAGASGGVFGLLGAMLLYAVFRIGDQSNRVSFFIIFVVFGLISLISGLVSWSHSDMAGHLGGMVTGIIVGIFFIPVVRKSKEVSL